MAFGGIFGAIAGAVASAAANAVKNKVTSGGGGGSGSGGGRGSGSSVGYYNKDTDYQALIDQYGNAASKDYDPYYAAVLEQQRNSKITGEGLDYGLTHNFESYLKPSSPGLTPTPTYPEAMQPWEDDPYGEKMQELADSILSRDKFSYDYTKDPLWAQYQVQYQREGDRNREDTLGDVAANTGGLASSWATTAASQAGDYYSSRLADKIPELYQAAYDRYQQELDSDLKKAGLLGTLSNTNYQRYRDLVGDWQLDRDRAYQQFRDQVGDRQWDQSFQHQAGRDQISDDRYQSEWDYGVSQDEYEKSWQKAQQLAQYGDFSGFRSLGYSETEIARMANQWQVEQAAQAAARRSSGSSGGRSSGGGSGGSGGSSGNGGMGALVNGGTGATDAELYGYADGFRWMSPTQRVNSIEQLLQDGKITEAQARQLLKSAGVN